MYRDYVTDSSLGALRINVASQEEHSYFINKPDLFGETCESVRETPLQILGRARKDAGKICG